jgi:hypothetical protein
MTSKRLVTRSGFLSLIAVLLLPACGNYSNEDLDFQLALPEQTDMEAKMQLSVTRLDSAEYYRATRTAITTFNGMVVELVGFIDIVRGTTPTSRDGDQRTWGPFPSDTYPGWEIRVVMQRTAVSPTLLQMDYWIQLRQVGQGDAAWVSLLTGRYISSGSARKGQGEIHLLANDVRLAGYPIDDDPGLVSLDHLDLAYDNTSFPITVTMNVVNLPTATTTAGLYQYFQNQDGSGQMLFDWQGVTDTGAQVSARMQSEWIGSGAGRADLIVDLTPNLPSQSTTLGIDCWGVDTLATYSYRLEGNLALGDPASCLF